MTADRDIVFVTTSLNTKWMDLQKKIVRDKFPGSEHIIIDGRSNWPNSWFYWINEIKERNEKWFIHVDEDFFIESREEILKLLDVMESDGYGISAISEAYCHYRGSNPVAMNSFFMVGRISDLKDFNFDPLKMEFYMGPDGWENNMGLKYSDEYYNDFNYTHEKQTTGEWSQKESEPYYAFFWYLKNIGVKFHYLYPHFDIRFRSTNPRITGTSNDIGIHMWYTRIWESNMDVHGMPNIKRYLLVEDYLKNKN